MGHCENRDRARATQAQVCLAAPSKMQRWLVVAMAAAVFAICVMNVRPGEPTGRYVGVL